MVPVTNEKKDFFFIAITMGIAFKPRQETPHTRIKGGGMDHKTTIQTICTRDTGM
jgi:hypothetical protein